MCSMVSNSFDEETGVMKSVERALPATICAATIAGFISFGLLAEKAAGEHFQSSSALGMGDISSESIEKCTAEIVTPLVIDSGEGLVVSVERDEVFSCAKKLDLRNIEETYDAKMSSVFSRSAGFAASAAIFTMLSLLGSAAVSQNRAAIREAENYQNSQLEQGPS